MNKFTFVLYTSTAENKLEVRLMNEIAFMKFIGDYFAKWGSKEAANQQRLVFVERFSSVHEATERTSKFKRKGQLSRGSYVRKLNRHWEIDNGISETWLNLVSESLGLISQGFAPSGNFGLDEDEGMGGAGVLAPIGPRPIKIDSFRQPWPKIDEFE